jgi:serine-type D-Ala-D-Ala carboxypeptidase (penicillin-binding protein 5/6)
MSPTQYLGTRGLMTAILLVVIGAVLGSGISLQRTFAAEIPRYEPMSPPPITAKAVFVTDLSSGTELFAMNADLPLPPASLTKIVSALVVLERARLDDVIEILEDDLVGPEESQVGLRAGDRLTVRDLLLGMLIPSGNDATIALARHVGTSAVDEPVSPDRAVEEFVALMNAKATALGAAASHFANPTGIDSDGHVMSARDIALITAVALQNSLFSEIVGTSSAVLSSEVLPEGYPVATTNLLLAEGTVTGVKTGTTASAGGCLVTSFAVGLNTVVAVVLGSEIAESTDGLQDNVARFADTRAILDAVRGEYVWLNPGSPGEISGLMEELSVWDVDLGSEGLLPVPAADVEDVRYRLVLAPPTDPQSPAGRIQFYIGTRLLSELPALQTP